MLKRQLAAVLAFSLTILPGAQAIAQTRLATGPTAAPASTGSQGAAVPTRGAAARGASAKGLFQTLASAKAGGLASALPSDVDGTELSPANAGGLANSAQPTAAPTMAPVALQRAEQGAATVAEAIAASRAAALRDARALAPPADAPKSLSEIDVKPLPGVQYTKSPEDWRDEVLYSLMVDRFSKSANGQTLGDPKKGDSRHGGDIQGVIERLDYLKGLGVTTLMLTPVQMGVPEAYHGYHPVHMLAIDPYLGNMADYKRLVKEAHKRGIRVIMDLVINHTGPVFEYKEGSQFGREQKEIEWARDMWPVEMKDPDFFNRRGEINDWNHPDQRVNGDFPPNLRDLATDKATVQAALIKIAKWWVKETDVDGLRLDAIRHVDASFLGRFSREIQEYAKEQLGKDNFFLLGEDSTGVDGDLAADLRAGTNAAYNYPEYRRINYALHGKAPTKVLEDSFRRTVESLGGAANQLVRFIDLHDTYRFLRKGEAAAMLNVAFSFLLFSMGIPLVYYGTEQAFRQVTGSLDPEGGHAPADPENRQDMFPEGQYKSESSAGDKFDTDSPSYKYFAKLAEIRKDHSALRRGEQYVRWNDPNGAGIYAFSRIDGDEEVLVVMNTAGDARQATMWVDADMTPAGTRLTDAVDGSFQTTANAVQGGGSQVTVSIPARGVRVLVRKANRTE